MVGLLSEHSAYVLCVPSWAVSDSNQITPSVLIQKFRTPVCVTPEGDDGIALIENVAGSVAVVSLAVTTKL